jgi:hypothetical protein
MLCLHVYKWHLLEYLMQALENSWPIMVMQVRMLHDQGYSIKEMKTHVETEGNLAWLPCHQNANTASKRGD